MLVDAVEAGDGDDLTAAGDADAEAGEDDDGEERRPSSRMLAGGGSATPPPRADPRAMMADGGGAGGEDAGPAGDAGLGFGGRVIGNGKFATELDRLDLIDTAGQSQSRAQRRDLDE